MFLDFIAIAIGGGCALSGMYLALEVSAGWLEEWRDGFHRKMKPLTDAYREFNESHAEAENPEKAGES
jgi:hypothetical protein